MNLSSKFLILAVIKGLAMMAIIREYAGVPFLESIVVAAVSAVISGLFLMIATHINSKETKVPLEKVEKRIEKQEES